jgi:outer membrane protein TolC
MKRNIQVIVILFIAGVNTVDAQKILTLKQCYDQAYAANPLAGEKTAYSQIWQLKDENLSKNWLPTLDANGNFLYNSSVVDLGYLFESLPIPGIGDATPLMPHDQYKITLDINQVIYDGGMTRSLRSLEKSDLSINQKQTETDLYKLRSQINNYFFRLLILDKQKELLKNYLELINKRIITLNSGLENGVILKSDIDVMTSEKIKLEQQLSENNIMKVALLKILSAITGTEIDASVELILPVIPTTLTGELARPEIELFDLRKEQLAAGIKVQQSKRMPKAYGFATLGYGNPPGSDFFRDEFDTYYVLGAGIKWNIFDWNKTKNEKQMINIQQGIIENRKSDLTDNINRQLESKNAEIVSLNTMLESDSSLIGIRKRITSSAESQYENGTITATELLNEMNSERQAMINYEIHKINLAMAKVEYMNISGKEIE